MMSTNHAIALDTVVMQEDSLLSAAMDDELVMMSLEKGAYYGMDAIASRIWELIEVPRSVAELCDLLRTEFDVELHVCQRDVIAFLQDVKDHEIIRIVAGPAES